MDASGENMARQLLGWYDSNARVLPWRSPPGTPPPDPYRVWLSEVMLQQTTVAAVAPYFATFTARWPDVRALAAAPDAEVMAAWAGLGYYSRARNLIAAARAVAAAGGRFPESEAGLAALPGVGAYTAAAVAAIAFNRRAVVLDANVERVVARMFAIATPLPAGKRAIRAALAPLVPADRPGDFAQAMMDLGATVCTSRAPRCNACPLAGQCAARLAGEAEAYPVKPPRKARPERRGRAFWIVREGAVWLVRRPPGGMLGAMRALPDDGWSARADGTGVAPLAGPWRRAGEVVHIFTHCRLTLELVIYTGDEWASLPAKGEWWPLEQLAAAGLPSLFAKAAALAVRDGGE